MGRKTIILYHQHVTREYYIHNHINQTKQISARGGDGRRRRTLIARTRLAVLLATSLADWTKCLLATGLLVLEEARRQVLHRVDVCLATTVAAERT